MLDAQEEDESLTRVFEVLAAVGISAEEAVQTLFYSIATDVSATAQDVRDGPERS